MQHTLKTFVTFDDKGLHTGEAVTMIVRPADAGHGIVFIRTDVGNINNIIPAKYNYVDASQLCTLLKNEDGASVSTIEHVMAAFAGMGIDNAVVELNGPEVPIMDGSAMPFIQSFEKVGLLSQNMPRRAYRIMKPVEVRDDQGRIARFEPDVSSVFEFKIDFDNDVIGAQHRVFELMDSSDFKYEIAECRTFTRLKDVEALMAMGLIKGGGLENAVVFDDTKILNPEGLRCADEPVRHKILDAIGDVYLAGAPIIGRFVCEKGGHALTNQLVRALFDAPEAFVETTDHLGIGQSENLSTSPKLAYNA
ncbi:MAG: UDP-3-O-[3-hydroxymyristoyl] N-acetylglucosamine deacetylase [Alphaproteobacteria bacterium]|nr:MAG: UDP-3-O-[3-hydroxymyristoyl] N-acetylglucosamine deacetylase [Alphaproteobacteria bacterium]